MSSLAYEDGKEKMTTCSIEGEGNGVATSGEVKIRYDAKEQGWLSYVVAIVTLAMLVGWFYVIAVIVLVCIYATLVHQSLVAVALVVVLFSSTYWPSQILWQEFIDLPIWKVPSPRSRSRSIPIHSFLFPIHSIIRLDSIILFNY